MEDVRRYLADALAMYGSLVEFPAAPRPGAVCYSGPALLAQFGFPFESDRELIGAAYPWLADFVQPGTAQAPRPLVAGDEVNVRVIAGSQQQRFSYRVVSTRPSGNARRVLVVAAEDYTGLSPNKTPYAAAPRYLDEHVAALQANGYAVETLDLDAPPAGPDGAAGSRQLSDLGVLSHFDAVMYYTGDDLLPQAVGEGVTDSNYRRVGTQNDQYGDLALTGSAHLSRQDVRNAQMLRNYMNEGGKVVFEGRNGWVQQTSKSTSLNTYSGYTWWQEPVYGFDYPPDQAGDDDRPHTAFFRELDISNDWGQWWLGVAGRRGGPGSDDYLGAPVNGLQGGMLAGLSIPLDTSPGAGDTLDPTQDPETGASQPAAKSPTRLRSISTAMQTPPAIFTASGCAPPMPPRPAVSTMEPVRSPAGSCFPQAAKVS